MTRAKSYTVQSAYQGRDGQRRVYLKGYSPVRPFLADDDLLEGDAARIEGERAVMAAP